MKFGTLPLVLCLCVPGFAADIAVIEEIIAKVNGDIITRSEVDRTRRQMEAEFRRQGLAGAQLEKELAEKERDLLRDRIDQLLLVQKGKELNINVDSELSKYLAQLQLDSKIAEPEKFQQYVREQTGQTFEDYKSEVRNNMLTQRVVRQEVGGRISVPRAELEKYYDEHKSEFVREDRAFISEIFISTEGKDEKGLLAAERKARDLVARARKGERFHELAKANSDAVTAQQNGYVGGFTRDQLNKQIADVVFANERGFVSDPIKLPNGYEVVRVDERHKAGQAGFDEVENEIMEKLFMPRMQPELRKYLTRLREEAFLEIKDGYVDSSAAPNKSTKWTDPAQLKPETVTKEEVANQKRRKRLLWTIPIPGTSKSTSSSSK